MRSWGSIREQGAGLSAPGRQARRDDRAERDRSVLVPARPSAEVERALAWLPSQSAIMTAAFEHKRSGLVVSRVMRCGGAPARIAVAVPSGQRLAMLIRDSRAFGLCLVDPSSRLLMKKFGEDPSINTSDPFDTLETRTLVSGAPLLMAATVSLDCEVVRHVDLEGDHEIYVGVVLGTLQGRGAAAVAVGQTLVRADGGCPSSTAGWGI